MAENRTKRTTASVSAFVDAIADEARRDDCRALVAMMAEATGEKPFMFGASIVGFGTYHYMYDSGHEGDSCLTGFSPRKQAISIYLMGGLAEHPALVKKLGKHKAGKGCLYVKRLSDVDPAVLKELIVRSVASTRQRYPS